MVRTDWSLRMQQPGFSNLLAMKIGTVILLLCAVTTVFGQTVRETGKEEFKRWSVSLCLESGTGYVATNTSTNSGLLTGSLAGGVVFRTYFKKVDTLYDYRSESVIDAVTKDTVTRLVRFKQAEYVPSDVSLYMKASWGPMLTATNIVPSFWGVNIGPAVDKFHTNIAYTVAGYINSSDAGPRLLLGGGISVDRITVPFFFNIVKDVTGSSFQYLLVGGIRLPLFDFVDIHRMNKARKSRG